MRRASIPAYHKAIRNNRTQLVNLGTSSELEIAVWESHPLERSVMLAIRDAFNDSARAARVQLRLPTLETSRVLAAKEYLLFAEGCGTLFSTGGAGRTFFTSST
jgi:hypothetical protein